MSLPQKLHSNEFPILSRIKNKIDKVLINFSIQDKSDEFLSLFCKVIYLSASFALIKMQRNWERLQHLETEMLDFRDHNLPY